MQSLSSFWNELFVHVCSDTLNKKALTVFVSTCLMAEQKKTNWDVPRGRGLCQWAKSHGSDSLKLGLWNRLPRAVVFSFPEVVILYHNSVNKTSQLGSLGFESSPKWLKTSRPPKRSFSLSGVVFFWR